MHADEFSAGLLHGRKEPCKPDSSFEPPRAFAIFGKVHATAVSKVLFHHRLHLVSEPFMGVHDRCGTSSVAQYQSSTKANCSACTAGPHNRTNDGHPKADTDRSARSATDIAVAKLWHEDRRAIKAASAEIGKSFVSLFELVTRGLGDDADLRREAQKIESILPRQIGD